MYIAIPNIMYIVAVFRNLLSSTIRVYYIISRIIYTYTIFIRQMILYPFLIKRCALNWTSNTSKHITYNIRSIIKLISLRKKKFIDVTGLEFENDGNVWMSMTFFGLSMSFIIYTLERKEIKKKKKHIEKWT